MLKDIRFHLEKDENKQAVLEEKLAERITYMRNRNLNAFQRSIPSLLHYFQSKVSHLSIFCNKSGKYNIVDYGRGRVLYGLDPEQEIEQHLSLFYQHAPYVAFENQASVVDDEDTIAIEQFSRFRAKQHCAALPKKVDVLIVLGCGLGQHIHMLLERCDIKHLIVYEPEAQYFSCSTYVEDWKDILDKANEKGTALYFQLEKDGRDLLNDVQELAESFDFDGFYFYQHYNHPIFDAISSQLSTRNWDELLEHGFSLKVNEKASNYVPTWTSAFDIQKWSKVDSLEFRREENLQAFKHYFPNIYKDFESYTPVSWFPYLTDNGEVNLVKKEQLVNWYHSSPRSESIENYELFRDYPNKDGLILGYTGEKLKHYLHYKFVAETEEFLEEKEDQTHLPERVKSLILFGMGCGYQLQELLNQHTVEKLFICEPNRDFFHASLYAIDWKEILEGIDKSGGRIYLNIGDDGSNLFRDLLNQFYSIGPYILANTYFYQSYHNSILTQAIGQLREQLMIVISMGEYFDHAYYGISHTRKLISRGTSFLKAGADKSFSRDDQEVPVFLIGNGPSLDKTYREIIEWQDKAIIVSCGTALQALYRYGITPDFHAEIEQNRSTYDWTSKIDAPEFLKQISLLSCNGVHPDTCELYKDVFLAFKEGESSTVSVLEASRPHNFEVLKFAFPTVSNFALNLFTKLGYKQIYLFGVDLGFVDADRHHSVLSGYYNNQQEQLYDYKSKNNTSIVVPGNFRSTVLTKHEFKVSQILMEQSLKAFDGDVYNTADGAKISGTLPLESENILITSDSEAKNLAIEKIKTQGFQALEGMLSKFDNKFDRAVLQNELNVFRRHIAKDILAVSDVETLVEKQKELLFASYSHGRSLLFYYLYGTVNYVNSVLLKMVSGKPDLADLKSVTGMWLDTFDSMFDIINSDNEYFDASYSLSTLRVFKYLLRKFDSTDIYVFSADESILHGLQHVADCGGKTFNIIHHSYTQLSDNLPKVDDNYCIVNIYNETQLAEFKSTLTKLKVNPRRIVAISAIPVDTEAFPDYICWLLYCGNVAWDKSETLEHNSYYRAYRALEYLSGEHQYRVVFMKYSVTDTDVLEKFVPAMPDFEAEVYDNIYTLAFAKAGTVISQPLLESGTRGLKLNGEITENTLVIKMLSHEEMTTLNNSQLSETPYLLGECNV